MNTNWSAVYINFFSIVIHSSAKIPNWSKKHRAGMHGEENKRTVIYYAKKIVLYCF